MRCAADNFWAQPPLTLLLGAIVAFLGRQRHAADFLGPQRAVDQNWQADRRRHNDVSTRL